MLHIGYQHQVNTNGQLVLVKVARKGFYQWYIFNLDTASLICSAASTENHFYGIYFLNLAFQGSTFFYLVFFPKLLLDPST